MMSSEMSPVATRTKRFWAFAIDQSILSILGVVVFAAVFSTQAGQISNGINAFFGDPLWSQAETLPQHEFDTRFDALIASPKVVESVQALAHPSALALGLSLILSALYYIVPTKQRGVTLGKQLLKIKVHTLEGELPDWGQSSLRYFAFIGLGTFGGIVAILDLIVNKAFIPSNTAVDVLTLLLSQATWVLTLISVVLICARIDRRGLHDLWARTIVLETTKQPQQDK